MKKYLKLKTKKLIFFLNFECYIFLLGIISGFPWVLIGSTLTLWFKEDGLSRSTIGWAGLIFTVYAINYLWAPFIDKLKIPYFQKNWSSKIMDTFNTIYNIIMFINVGVC